MSSRKKSCLVGTLFLINGKINCQKVGLSRIKSATLARQSLWLGIPMQSMGTREHGNERRGEIRQLSRGRASGWAFPCRAWERETRGRRPGLCPRLGAQALRPYKTLLGLTQRLYIWGIGVSPSRNNTLPIALNHKIGASPGQE